MSLNIKEQGWVLVIDQASNCAGVSLWYNGDLKATTELRSESSKDSFARRLQHQVPQLTAFLDRVLPDSATITKILFEGVRSRLVLVTVGAFLTCPRINAKLSPRTNFIESTSWKVWARNRGATGPIADIKGIKSLKETGFHVDDAFLTSEDVADSIMMFNAWREKP